MLKNRKIDQHFDHYFGTDLSYYFFLILETMRLFGKDGLSA